MRNPIGWTTLIALAMALWTPACGGADSGDDASANGDAWDTTGDPGDPVGDGGATDGIHDPETITPILANYVIVADDSLAEGAGHLAAYRTSTGHEVALYTVSDLLPDPLTPYDLIEPVRGVLRAARQGMGEEEPLYLLLVGDSPTDYKTLEGRIPAIPCQNIIGDCTTDNVYADLDDDHVPEVAVGRIPAATNQQVKDYLDKLKGHETGYEVGFWNRRIVVYTGEANFSAEIDALLEMAVMEGLTRVSHGFDVLGCYDNPTSAYYYEPFEEKVVELFNMGSLMVVYVGHGTSEWTQGLDADQIPKVHCQHRLPMAMFFACYAGNYAGSKDSLAEQLLFKPDGPIVAFASTDVSHPYGNAVLAYEVQRAVLDRRPPTAGLAMVESKIQSIHNQDDFRDFIDAAALLEVAEYEQSILKNQHLDLYNLLGDPAASVKYPATEVAFSQTDGSVASGNIKVAGTTPGVVTGTAYVALETERDVIPWDLEPVDPDNPDQATIQSNWAKAIDKVILGEWVDVTDGTFEADLWFPDDQPAGTYWIKVYAMDDTTDSFGFVQAP